MKFVRYFGFFCAVLFGFAASASADRRDVLGAHLNYGRGCPACHVSHTAALRNHDGSVSNATMLWGEDVSSTYRSNGGKELYAGIPAESPEKRGILVCLTCHTGNYAPAAMMRNSAYEPLPYHLEDSDSIPTFADKPLEEGSNRLSEHPSGVGVHIGCGGALAWDCLESHGTLRMAGARSSKFVANYGYFLKQHSYARQSVVVCTTCHNPHSMNLTDVTSDSASQVYPPGVYATKYFLRAPYGEGLPSRNSNQAAQFCRQCHAELSNELNGSTAGTIL